MTRILSALVLAAVMVGAPPASAEKLNKVELWKSPSCGCCTGWMKHMQQAKFSVNSKDTTIGNLSRIKSQAGLKPDLHACHTAKVGGYVIEGHVPAQDVARLLEEKPDAIGLAVPGMPIGSPGMESGDKKEPYEVLLVKKDGTAEVFARH